MTRKAIVALAIAGGMAFATGPAITTAGAHADHHRQSHRATHHQSKHDRSESGSKHGRHGSEDSRRHQSQDDRSTHRRDATETGYDRSKHDRSEDQTKHDESNDQPSHQCGTSNTVSDQDREYLMTAIEGDHFEITGGQMAQDRGVDPSTKALGARLVADHTKSLADATELAQRLGITVPTTMSDKQRAELADVAAYPGVGFDDEYAELEVSDHQQDIADATKEWNEGCNPEVRDNAKTEIPTLQQHLDMSQQVHETIEAIPGHDDERPDTDES